MDPVSEHRQQLRSLRDFLLVYNRMTELCFRHCVCNLNYRLLTGHEERCLDRCAGKLVHANHRLVSAYVGQLPALLQRRAPPEAPGTAQGGQEGPAAPPEPPAAPAGALGT